MRAGRGFLGAIALALAIAPACSAPDATRKAALAPAPSHAGSTAHLPYETPARWTVHPTPSYATSAMRLADGRCLVVEYSGQRWITQPRRDKADPTPGPGDEQDYTDDRYEGYSPPEEVLSNDCSGTGRAAMERMPEPLVGVVRWAGAYGFVGESGTIHVTTSPLGRVVRRVPPPEPMTGMLGTAGAVLAMTPTGRVLRWSDVTGYEPVDLEGTSAIDIAVDAIGHAVVLAAPESVFTTEDAGRHFVRVKTPMIGAQRVARAPGGPFLIEGARTSLAWDPRDGEGFVKTSERIVDRAPEVVIDAQRHARAGLVSEGRAVLDGDRYWETEPDEGNSWAVWKGRLDGQVSLGFYVADSENVNNVMVAANGLNVALALFRWDDARNTVELRVSHDGGATFGESVPLWLSQLSPIGLAISAEGTVLITGACFPGNPDDDSEASCAGGPLVARTGAALAAPRLPETDSPAVSPAFSPDGRSAYFLVQHDGDRHAAMFASHDGGASFELRALELDTEEVRATFEISPTTTLSVSEQGTVGFEASADGDLEGSVYVTTDADGRHVQAAAPPSPSASLAGCGERVLAVSRARGDDAGTPVQESLDGGLHWNEVSSPLGIKEPAYRTPDVACSALGCLVGEDLTRIGWGGTRSDSPAFEPPVVEPLPKTLRTLIACDARPGSPWTRIDNVALPAVFPSDHEAARGPTAWMIPTLDPQTGAIAVVSTPVPKDDGSELALTTKTLLGPLPAKGSWAITVRPQIEGVAVARLPLDAARPPSAIYGYSGRPVENLEVAWENLEEGSSGRAVLPRAGTLESGAVTASLGRFSNLSLDLLSVSPGGIFVGGSALDTTALFVETSGKTRSFQIPPFPTDIPKSSRIDGQDYVNVDGTFVRTAKYTGPLPNGPDTLFLMRPPAAGEKPDAPWTSWSKMLAPAADGRRKVTITDWAYDGGHLAVWTLHAVAGSGQSVAWMQRVKSDGTLSDPARIPTPMDLGKAPRPCSASEHKDLPRLRFSLDNRYGSTPYPGARHPVIVRYRWKPPADPKSKVTPEEKTVSLSLLSTGFVLRGSPASPCVDAFAARGVEDAALTALVTGDLKHGWLFRLAEDSGVPVKGKKPASKAPPGTAIEVRPLACHYDLTLPVPQSILDANSAR